MLAHYAILKVDKEFDLNFFCQRSQSRPGHQTCLSLLGISVRNVAKPGHVHDTIVINSGCYCVQEPGTVRA